MASSDKTTVAIVKGCAILGSSLKQAVQVSANFRVVCVLTTGGEILQKIGVLRPDVVLMDIDLPDISGIEATARIKQFLPEIHVIMVTGKGDHNKVLAALRVGATGYLLEKSSIAEVQAAIKDVLMSAEIDRRIAESFYRQAQAGGAESELSNREIEVLEQLSEGLKNKEIALRLDISIETVRVHLRKIYRKIEVSSRIQAVVKFRNSFDPASRAKVV